MIKPGLRISAVGIVYALAWFAVQSGGIVNAAPAASTPIVIGPTETGPLEAYTVREVKRLFKERFNTNLEDKAIDTANRHVIVIGTAKNNPLIAGLIKQGFIKPESRPEGYSMRCAPHPKNPKVWLLAIAGADSRGALYALRDLEHYEMGHFTAAKGKLTVKPFARRDYPRIQHRGHWVWGCNMPDKKAWLENMSRWKMNELIHWDNFPPKRAKEYVRLAHERGIRVIWGFGWGWNPDWNFALPKGFDHGVGKGVQMCGSSAFNHAFFKREILRKIREDYVPTGCDGVYFQSFTEVPKCQCEQCAKKTKGQLMLEFVTPILDDIKKEFPDLWVSCGIHRNLGRYDELKDLPSWVNIYWENCPSGVSIRGADEDYGYINKTLPYGHGFSKTCPADPSYTEASLQKWMKSNAHRYSLKGDINTYYRYMQGLQGWARGMLGKPAAIKHGSTVADHSVFCRRTPYMHVALAEAMWNPDLDTEKTVEQLVVFLKANGGLPGFSGAASRKEQAALAIAQHDAVGKTLRLATRYHGKYRGGGDGALTDGRRAVVADAGDRAWQGYEKQNLDAVIDLGKPMSINALAAGFLHQPRAGVHFPEQVEFAISRDNKTFEVVDSVKAPANAKANQRHAYRIDGLDLYKVRYVRVRASYVKHWLFVDEIMVNPIHPNQ